MDELKWCERCQEWKYATPRRCSRCSAKWSEMAVQGRRTRVEGEEWPLTPPENGGAPGASNEFPGPFCEDYYVSDLHNVEDCRACCALKEQKL